MVGLGFNKIHLMANPNTIENKSLWITRQEHSFLIHLWTEEPARIGDHGFIARNEYNNIKWSLDAESKVIDAENNDYVALKALEPTHPDNPFEKLLIIDYDTREWGDLSSDNPPDCPVYPEELLSPTLDLLSIIDFGYIQMESTTWDYNGDPVTSGLINIVKLSNDRFFIFRLEHLVDVYKGSDVLDSTISLFETLTKNKLSELDNYFENAFMTYYGEDGGYFTNAVPELKLSKTEKINCRELVASIIELN